MNEHYLERSGGCACGAVRFIARGAESRVGLCHCRTCQTAHGAPYFAFVVFPKDAVALSGAYEPWASSPHYLRLFCPTCGSRFASLAREEIELAAASFDDPSGLTPQYENWTVRRLPWVAPLAVPQFPRDPEW